MEMLVEKAFYTYYFINVGRFRYAFKDCHHAARALAAAEYRSGADLVGSLSPSFVEEQNNVDFNVFAEEFAPLGNALADTTLTEDIVNKVFLE